MKLSIARVDRTPLGSAPGVAHRLEWVVEIETRRTRMRLASMIALECRRMHHTPMSSFPVVDCFDRDCCSPVRSTAVVEVGWLKLERRRTD